MQIEFQSKYNDFIRAEFNKYRASADFVAFKLVKEDIHVMFVRNAKPDYNREFFDVGLLIEVMINGHLGYASTCELTTEGVKAAFDKAVYMTKKVIPLSLVNFDHHLVRPKATGHYSSPIKKPLDQLSFSEVYDFLVKTSKALKVADKIVSAISENRTVTTQQMYLNSNGSDFEQNFSIVYNSFTSIAQDGPETQSRSVIGGRSRAYQGGAELIHLDSLLSQCQQAGQEAIELLTAPNCPTEVCDLILSPDQMNLQIHESIGHPLEIDRILGDERNFAGYSFVRPDDFGKLQYGSPLMNVVFDPSISHQVASYHFDEVGNSAQKTHLIKDGILQAGLGSLESQFRSKQMDQPINGVANSRSSSWNRAPIDRMANINLEGGAHSLEELIARTKRGVIMWTNQSWSIDDYRRKFQFGCEYAKLIEDGKLTKTVKNPNYRGVTVPFWNSLVGLTSSVETYGEYYCGKGEPSQIIRTGHASPYALFSNIEVFGGG